MKSITWYVFDERGNDTIIRRELVKGKESHYRTQNNNNEHTNKQKKAFKTK